MKVWETKRAGNTQIPWVVILVLVVVLPTVSEALESSNFKWHLTLTVPGGHPLSPYRLTIPAEFLARSEAGWGDMRLFDAKGRELPYAVISDAHIPRGDSYDKLTISAYREEDRRQIIILQKPDSLSYYHHLELQTPDTGFFKSYVLSVSDDKIHWRQIAKGEVFDFNPRIPLRHTLLYKGVLREPFCKVVIESSDKQTGEGSLPRELWLKAPELELTFKQYSAASEKLKVSEMRIKSGRLREVTYDKFSFPLKISQPVKDGTAVIIPAQLSPVERLYLSIENPYFYRRAVVQQYVEKGKRWIEQGSSQVLYRIPGSAEEKSWITVKGILHPHRTYRLLIINDDNPPLIITQVQAGFPRRYLCFVPVLGQQFTLAIGNPEVVHPRYEMAKIMGRVGKDIMDLPAVSTGKITANTRYVPLPKAASNVWKRRLLVALVCILAIIGAVWLYSLLSHLPQQQNNESPPP